jgi:hypothetical protein
MVEANFIFKEMSGGGKNHGIADVILSRRAVVMQKRNES